MSAQTNTTIQQQAQPSRAAADRAIVSEGKSMPAAEAAQAEAATASQDTEVIGIGPDTPFQLKTSPTTGQPAGAEQATAFQAPLQRKETPLQAAPVQFVPTLTPVMPMAPGEAGPEQAVAPGVAPAAAPAAEDPAAHAQFPSPDAEYEAHWAPGMTLMTGAAMAGKAGIAGAEKAGSAGIVGAKKSLELAGEGIVGSGELALAGAKKSGKLALAGAEGSVELAGKGVKKSGELALAGAKKSGELGLAGAKGSLELAGSGIEKSGKLALAGAKKSGELGLAGAKKSMALAGSGIEASGAFAAAPARWAKEKMSKTDSRAERVFYAVAGGLGTLVSAPVGLAGAIGSGALGAAGAVGSGALGLTGAAASGAAGLTGAAASGALGLTGAVASGAAGLTGTAASGALGATGALGSAALGATGAVASGAAGLTGAAASGAAGLTGAAASGALGLTGAAASGAAGLTGATLAGSAGLAGAATAGSLGLVGMAGGGLAEGAMYAKGAAKENLNKELLGIYKPGAAHPAMGDSAAVSGQPGGGGEFHDDGRRINYGAVSGKEGVQYGMMGLGGASTVGSSITDMASKGNVVGASIAQNDFRSPLAGGAEAFGGLAAGAGILGAGASLVDAGGAAKEAMDSSQGGANKAMFAGQAASSIADATKSTASAAYNIAGLVDAKGAAAAGAQIAAGGAAIATGAIDILRGGYGLHTAGKRAELLQGIADGAKTTGNKEIENIAMDAKSTQERAKVTAGGQIAKGAIAVTGGILLAASMATPIGWMILGVGAAVGIGVAIKNWWDKRAKKKEVVMRELGVTDAMTQHEKVTAAIEASTGIFTKARKQQLAEHEKNNPLKNKLKEFGFTSVGHCYTNYMNATANKLYQSGVVNHKADYEQIITSIGLKIERKGVDPTGWKPTPEKIAKTLTG